MATSYNNLVVQQLYDARPSPTFEVNKTLDIKSDYSPGHTPCPSPGLRDRYQQHQHYAGTTTDEQQEKRQQQEEYKEKVHSRTMQNESTSIAPSNATSPIKISPNAPPPTPITSPSVQTSAGGDARTAKRQQADQVVTKEKISTTTSNPKNGQQSPPPRREVVSPSSPVASTPTRPQPPPANVATSPKGVTDVYSLSDDKQLADRYTFVEEIGYGNWVSAV